MEAEKRLALVASLADFFKGHPDVDRFPMLATLGDLLRAVEDDSDLSPIEASSLPVVKLLNSLTIDSESFGVEPILRALVEASPTLVWIQTRAYAESFSQNYLDHYGYVRVLGPGGLVESSVAAAGLGLWGPGLTYPRHAHPAEEYYHVLHGSALFQRGNGTWEPKNVGDSVHHSPWERHAQRFGDDVCVLLYAWTGEVTVDARLVTEESES